MKGTCTNLKHVRRVRNTCITHDQNKCDKTWFYRLSFYCSTLTNKIYLCTDRFNTELVDTGKPLLFSVLLPNTNSTLRTKSSLPRNI